MIANRHIRHDWQMFVDWEQKSVRTMCGIKTRRNLAGIPGISTDQLTLFFHNDKLARGWCKKCCEKQIAYVQLLDTNRFAPEVKSLYDAVSQVVRYSLYLGYNSPQGQL